MAYEHIKVTPVGVDADVALEDSCRMVEVYPARCPAAVGQVLRPYVGGRVFCDLGCGAGDLVRLLGRYVKESIGIERKEERSKHWASSEANTRLIRGDYLKLEMPVADVYFYWGFPEVLDEVVLRLEAMGSACLLIGAASSGFLDYERLCADGGKRKREPSRLLRYVDIYKGRVVSFLAQETSGGVEGWNEEMTWCLCVIPLNGAKVRKWRMSI